MKKRLLAALLTLCMVLTLLPTVAFAEGETVKPQIDIVWLVDSTGSMDSIISQAKKQMESLGAALSDFDVRCGLAGFGDVTNTQAIGGCTLPEATTPILMNGSIWTSSWTVLKDSLSKLPKYFGGDGPETPTNAIITVVDAYDWRADALRVIILATDVRAKTEKDSTKTVQVASMSETVSKCNEKQVSVNLVGSGSYNYAPILDGTGGAYQSSGNMLPIVQRIHDTPIVTTQPADCYTYEGSNVTFTAGSLAGKTVDYAWYYVKDGTQTVVESATTNTDVTLTLSGVQKDISGRQYFCRFTNTGSDTRTIETRYATLDVHTNFAITKQPADQRVEAGQSAVFTVAATGDDLTYQWQKLDGSAWVDLSGETNASLTISATVADNGTRYRCVIWDAISEQTGITLTSDPVTLTVVAAPEITKQPQSLRVEAGQSAAFTVEATGDELTYQWQKLDGSEWISLPGETNTSLTISKAVLREDGSTFRCLVCSSFGTLRTSNSVTLTVVAAPEITKQPADQRVEARAGCDIHGGGDGRRADLPVAEARRQRVGRSGRRDERFAHDLRGGADGRRQNVPLRGAQQLRHNTLQ